MKEKKARVEDALHATRAAVEEGIVAGGFFQAEDGIRAAEVTGVQTCALPISPSSASRCRAIRLPWHAAGSGETTPCNARSEERRVGKECRSRWSRYH